MRIRRTSRDTGRSNEQVLSHLQFFFFSDVSKVLEVGDRESVQEENKS